MSNNLYTRARACLDAAEPHIKQQLTQDVAKDWAQGKLARENVLPPEIIADPGRPARPLLVSPREVPQRKLTSEEGRVALIHAIAHIEFNAINLALDAVYRFRSMPDQFYTDWLKVAVEEAYHFSLLRNRLQNMGHDYGDFPAHNGLWEMACKTADDVLVRMALVPRVLEARGLDVTPGMIDRLEAVGDVATVEILHIIFRDEIGHVDIGSHWFRYCCEQRELDPSSTFRRLLEEHMKGHIKGPFAEDARLQAGFDAEDMALLRELSGRKVK